MPSVVHVDTSHGWRGGQLQVFLLHRELVRSGVSSRLLVRDGSGLHRRCEEAGLPVEPVPILRAWYPPALAAVTRNVRSADIVHAHDAHAATLAVLARVTNPGLAVVCHRRIAYPVNGGVAGRWKHRHVDRWIAVSTEIAEVLRRAGAADLRVVPSAVDIDELIPAALRGCPDRLRSELEIGAGAPVIGLFGALVPQKGHDTLIAAAPMILAATPDAVFLVVGEGRLRRRLEKEVRRAGLAQAFRFAGFRRDAPALMALCAVVAAPSRHGEGSSAVLKEAMAVGTAVVASDLRGNLEVLGNRGIAFPSEDADALARAVVSVLGSPSRRSALAGDAGEARTRWSPTTMAAGVLAAYDGLGLRAEGLPGAA
jgi:glycosyltransferase involved in cell wall biosynthesis